MAQTKTESHWSSETAMQRQENHRVCGKRGSSQWPTGQRKLLDSKILSKVYKQTKALDFGILGDVCQLEDTEASISVFTKHTP